jgi:hypothetical protein
MESISKKDQKKEYTPLSTVIHTTRLQAAHKENTTDIDNSNLPERDRPLLKKTKNPKNNEIIIDGQWE